MTFEPLVKGLLIILIVLHIVCILAIAWAYKQRKKRIAEAQEDAKRADEWFMEDYRSHYGGGK